MIRREHFREIDIGERLAPKAFISNTSGALISKTVDHPKTKKRAATSEMLTYILQRRLDPMDPYRCRTDRGFARLNCRSMPVTFVRNASICRLTPYCEQIC